MRLLLLAFQTEMFEIPPAIAPRSYFWAASLVGGAAVVSAILIGRKLWRQDLVTALKGRE